MKGLTKYVAVILSLSLVFCYSSTTAVFAADAEEHLLDQAGEEPAGESPLEQQEADQEVVPSAATAAAGAIQIADESLTGKDIAVPISNDDQVISFPDLYFEQEVRKAIHKPTGDILVRDVSGLTDLHLFSKETRNIEGIEHFTSLKDLGIYAGNLEDITPIKELKQLNNLIITYTPVKNIQALSHLENLWSLSLNNNKIEDLSPISQLRNLTSLNIKGNNIRDITPLSDLTKLSFLYLAGNQITDFTPTAAYYNDITYKDFSLDKRSDKVIFPDPYFEQEVRKAIYKPTGDILVRDVSGLTDLHLFSKETRNIEGIEHFISLKDLGIYAGNLEDITPIKELKQLDNLIITYTSVKNIQALSHLENLRSLSLNNNKIKDLSPISQLRNLTSLNLKGNNISDITPLSDLTKLSYLYLAGNQITDFTPTAAYYNDITYKDFSLDKRSDKVIFPDPYFEQEVRKAIYKPTGDILVRDVSGLTELHLFSKETRNIEGIEHFTSLKDLGIYVGNLEDITPIKELKQLDNLIITYTPVKDIQALSHLENLRSLSLNNNKIKDLSPISQLRNLTSLNLKGNNISDITPLSDLTKLSYLYLAGNLITDFKPTAAYYNNLSNKDFLLSKTDLIPITSVTVNPEQLVLTVGDQPAKLRATIVPTNATFNTLLWSSSNEKVAEVSREGEVRAVGAGTATITVRSLDQKEWAKIPVTVYDKKVEVNNPNQTIPVGENGFTVAVAAQADNAKLQYNALQVNESLKVATSPLIKAEMQTSVGLVELLIPQGTLIRGAAKWDGSLPLPVVKPNNSVSVDGATSILTVIEVGFNDQELLFDQPVRLVIPGQAGRKAGYIKQGQFHPIEKALSADTLEAAKKEIAAFGEAKIDVGKDLVIWTKHFTTFVAYDDQKGNPPGPGPGSGGPVIGGGGGVPVPPTTTDKATAEQKITKADGGTVTVGTITVKVQPDTVSEEVTLTIEKITGTDLPTYPSSLQFLKEAYKLSADKNITWNKAQQITMKVGSTLLAKEWSQLVLYQWSSKEGKWKELSNQAVNQAEKTISGELAEPAIVALFLDTSRTAPEQGGEVAEIKLPTDIKGHWAESAITQLVKQGIVQGLPDGTFAPNQKVTRAEFTTFLVRALGLEPLEGGKVFADTANHWARKNIAAAHAKGIASGYTDKQFGANDRISREQMAVMLVKALELKPATAKMTFKDAASISKWAQKEMNTAIANGILTGVTADKIQPQGEATRAEAAAMIVRALAKR
ncbi:leucine-rich repeat domain-containing protein [Paenibacillus sp. GCM10027626]|uniref:leucine-rich repeat domain-containing protein n=1 Tax=Paenibacillus sp. GCM10027626 TaxID=3273411 RepID=UPI003637E58D